MIVNQYQKDIMKLFVFFTTRSGLLFARRFVVLRSSFLAELVNFTRNSFSKVVNTVLLFSNKSTPLKHGLHTR